MHARHRQSRALVALAVLLAGPAWAIDDEDGSEARPSLVQPGGLNLFYDSEGPMSFVTPSPRDRPKQRVEAGEVRGRACQRGISIPLTLSFRPTSVSAAYGRGGYDHAMADLRKKNPTISGIYDVRVDTQTTTILGIFRRTCTHIVARAFL
jgi:hypothetical protein